MRNLIIALCLCKHKAKYKKTVSFWFENNVYCQNPACDWEWNSVWKTNFILDNIYPMEIVMYFLSILPQYSGIGSIKLSKIMIEEN